MFRRKVRHSGGDENIPGGGEMLRQAPLESSCGTPNMDTHRSRSTSELLAADDPTRRMGSGALCNANTGLSVSHDSVFTGEPQSGSDLELDTAQSSSSLSIQQLVLPGIRAELLDAVRRRRGRGDTSEDDEDLGLPRSPCNSPTTADILLEKSIKEHPTKSHSTCSDGSLLSMGSSEMDEDSYGMHSGHSSKGSLHDKPRLTNNFDSSENELELGYTETSAPLSHSAARHKMAVRPKRTHGAPRRRRVQQLTSGTSLPTTPEVNEEASARSVTPEVISKQEASATEYNKNAGMTGVVPPETRLKSASLPLGITSGSGYSHLSRSRSNAASVPQDSIGFPRSTSHDNELGKPNKEVFSTVGEEDEDEKILNKDEKKKEDSFFGRLLSRRSGKKKKEKVEEVDSAIVFKQKESVFNAMNIKKRFDEKGQYINESSITSEYNVTSKSNISKLPRSGPASRQRVEPIEIPASPETRLKKVGYTPPFLSNSPENKCFIEGNQNKQSGEISSTNIHSTKSRFMNETQHLDFAEKSSFSNSQELLYSHKVYSKTVAEKSFTYDNSPPKSEFVKNVPSSTVKMDSPEEVELVKKVTVSYNESKSELSKKPPLPQISSVELNTDNHNVTIASKTSNIHVQNIAVRSPTEHLNFFNNSPPSVDYHKKRMDSYMETCVNALNENRSMNKETIHPRQRRLDSYVTVEPPSLPQEDNFAAEEESIKQIDDEYDKLYSNSFYSISPPKTDISEQHVESAISHLQQSVSYSKSPPKMNVSENIYTKNQTSKSYSTSPPKKISSQQQHSFTKNQQAMSYAVPPLRVNSSDMYSKKQSSKSRVSMSGLSSHQQKLSQFNETVIIDKTEHDFTSLNYYPDEYVSSFNVNPIVKSHSFKHKSEPIEKSNEMPSLPCHLYNNYSNKIDLTNKSNSSKQLINSETEFSKSSSDLSFNVVKETDIQNQSVDKFDSKYKKSSMKKSSSLSNVNSADTKFMESVKNYPYEVSSCIDSSQDMIIEEKKSDINKLNITKVDKMGTSKLQKLSISSDSNSSEMQTSNKINVKRESRVIEKNGVPNVPEFLKIQLNKVDNKPTVNVVLSTNISNVEENRFPEVEIILQENNKVENEKPEIVSKRKFSKDDVEIFEKDDRKLELSKQSYEEIEDVIKSDVFIGSQDSSRKTENTNVRKISNISTSSTGSTHSMVGLKPQLRKKSSSLELAEPKKDAVKKQLSDGCDVEKIKEDHKQSDKKQNTLDNNQETVVLRKKSITAPKNDEEPELMKVFARRSLKLNGDSELLGQQVLVMLDEDNKRISNNVSTVTRKSRDSDKENETDSPHEERRKTSVSHLTKDFPVKSKEILVESKVHVETSEITLKTSSFNNVKSSTQKLQKTGSSSEVVTSKENENCRINTENTIETKTEKTLHTVWSQIKRDRDIDITNKIETSKKNNNSNKNDIIDTKDNKNEETGEDFLPMFKRIQQRKEEWEKRAQQAMQQKNFP